MLYVVVVDPVFIILVSVSYIRLKLLFSFPKQKGNVTYKQLLYYDLLNIGLLHVCNVM